MSAARGISERTLRVYLRMIEPPSSAAVRQMLVCLRTEIDSMLKRCDDVDGKDADGPISLSQSLRPPQEPDPSLLPATPPQMPESPAPTRVRRGFFADLM